ncbi:uncharacterized membrane-anchored protein YjiN (DUF445 family) [Kitasatospora gansuensis]|uniref:Uncharacterized membrane-anchored protein YjiN (DUF445 family) n=1 Tax=Kitasatospora gansuensis TaxID=258050 RepID=A0A7W7WJX6_9ACTN|nr:DUF445 domain-containing protein [Kitasatospora gansuensis]MBB4949109.1 uncharacterized membrane-anchored protein YjiN (DUF445 family) [Kitasatospora gansuensis]
MSVDQKVRPVTGLGVSFTAADEEKRRGVRRMKLFATGLLGLATVVFALATWADAAGAGAWAGYVAAAAEAGMVGALADWFAVTALFRRPFGLPIPHTAIIPTKKDAFGQSLGDFVGDNFLSAPVVRDRLGRIGIARRLGEWLAAPGSAERVTSEAAAALRGVLAVLNDDDVQAVVAEAVTRRAAATSVAEPAGRLLGKVVADGGHHGVVDLIAVRVHDWLTEHHEDVVQRVTQKTPGWTPKFIDHQVGERVYKELMRFVTDIRDDPQHPARGAVDNFLADFATELQQDPATIARVERAKADLLARPEVQELIASSWSAVRTLMLSAAEDEQSELRRRIRDGLRSFGRRLATDARLQAKTDGWLQDAAQYVVETYRAEITALISETVAGWDADDASRKIEANVGRDLQFIRINGTVVGALAGLLIHTVALALGG